MSVSALEITKLVCRLPSSDYSLDLSGRAAQGSIVPIYAGDPETEVPDRFEIEIELSESVPGDRKPFAEMRKREKAINVTLTISGVEQSITVPVEVQDKSFTRSSNQGDGVLSTEAGRPALHQRLEVVDPGARDTLFNLLRQ